MKMTGTSTLDDDRRERAQRAAWDVWAGECNNSCSWPAKDCFCREMSNQLTDAILKVVDSTTITSAPAADGFDPHHTPKTSKNIYRQIHNVAVLLTTLLFLAIIALFTVDQVPALKSYLTSDFSQSSE